MDSVKTKDLARALFTPNKKLDTSCDSVNPLDSTCEEESCDLSADQGLANQSGDDVGLIDLNIEGGDKQNVSTLQNVSDVNLVMDVSKKAIYDESYSNSPILGKDDTHLKDTSTDNVNTSPMASSSPDKLQAISPLQNLVTSDLRPLNTSLNESTDSVKMLNNKYQLPKAELKEHTPERVVDSDSKASNFCNDKASSPMMSPTNSENTAALITSPTFSQKSARKRNKIVSERSPTSSPRFSIDCALSDFFDPPSSAVGRRKRAPKKRKSTEMDASSEFEVSDISIKCSTPKENMTLHSILSSKKKEKKSVKKVRFSDAVLTKKVTFNLENEEIKVDLKDSSHEYLGLKKEDKSDAEGVKQSRKDSSKVKDEKITKHERSVDRIVIDENMRDKQEVDTLQNVDNKDRQMGLPVKSDNRENLTYCKRRGLKMRSKKECRLDQGKNKLFDSRLGKSGESAIDKGDTNLNLSETSNDSMRNSDISEDSEAFSQVSPSALTEMCDIAQNASGDANKTGGHHKKASVSRNNNSNHNSAVNETVISKLHALVRDKAKQPVPKKILNASPIEKSVQPVFNKQPHVTAPRKFFYPSSRQIGATHSKKVFEYKHENDRTENAGLVKSVSVKDIILKPDKAMDKQIDSEKRMDADKQKDGGEKKDVEKHNDAWKLVDTESDTMRINHTKAKGVKDAHAGQMDTNGKNDEFLVVDDCYYLKILYTASERYR